MGLVINRFDTCVLSSKVLGDGISNLIGWMQCLVEVNLGWVVEVSRFLMGFLENNHVA